MRQWQVVVYVPGNLMKKAAAASLWILAPELGGLKLV